ncbi:MAG: IS110 family transposase [Pseudonocardiales bacterium]|nr:IS110 family transposase [Pseudonocardiales bacterium]
MLSVSCGIDWAEDHHDVALVDVDGALVTKRRISDDAVGFGLLLELLVDAGDSAEDPIPVAIETTRGLLVACLRATGRKVYAINPKAVDRYRDRHSVARKKSDAGDALVLAHILRTDKAAHRPLPADSELAQAIAVLARAQQDAVWERTCAHNKLRSLLREYYPAILAAFASQRGGILRPEARAILAAAPTPAAAAKLTKAQLRKLLAQAGRQRGIDAEADRLHAVLRAEYLHHPQLVEDAYGMQALALLRQLTVACSNADELAAATVAHFDKHPDAEIITSLPGLGSLTGARVLAEIGDDRSRFADARSLKAYAGSAPVTRASGKSLTVTHRRVKNQRLAAVGYVWAFASLTASPGARAHYDRRRNAGDRHTAAQRNLFNRMLGCLHHCLDTRDHYNENAAFPTDSTTQRETAA